MGGSAVEVAGGFVGQDHRGFADQGAGNGHTLALPTGEVGGAMVGAFGEADLCEHALGVFHRFMPRHAAITQGQRDVVQGTEAWQQVEALEHETDLLVADRRQLIGGGVENIVAGKVVLAAVGQVQQAEDIEQGAFAGARGTENAAAVTAGDGQAHVIENAQFLPGELIALADALQGNQAGLRGGLCHHDYACSLDGTALLPETLCNKLRSCL
ncbi:hypothetical protein PFLmoz3_04012 [Pseudomonas fluorescens]|uniref:Uncharacterized protein n=1 Tax=Pseudomonas fluorescens TaxID=294 RepID=A0A109LF08_PSEFL|nr:hypothetical protein PFLmoz3_04012 [Pseudomonas fluorescens]